MKEIWCDEYERLMDELEREPTDKEVDDAVADRLGDLADRAKLARKDLTGWTPTD